jgi:hypothetical protein
MPNSSGAAPIALALLIGIHGLIHLLGPAKAFGWAEVQQLATPIPPLSRALWLLAAVLLVGAAIGFALGARWWWRLGLPSIVLSQVLITQSWSDAMFGTVANLVIAVPLVLLAVDARPSGAPTSANISRLGRAGHASAAHVRAHWTVKLGDPAVGACVLGVTASDEK